jgi:hypothetical protein
LKDLAERTEQVLERLGDTAMQMLKTAGSADCETAFAHAVPFQEVMGDVLMAWMLLWRATVAFPKLEKFTGDLTDKDYLSSLEKNKNAAFYDGQIRSAEYFIRTILPVTRGKMNSINEKCSTIADMAETAFGGY